MRESEGPNGDEYSRVSSNKMCLPPRFDNMFKIAVTKELPL